MPKFSDSEKELIRKKLLEHGERLFSIHGIKKVTVDDLVTASGIAKGSFYSFYKTKEYLYMDIISDIHSRIYTEAENYLSEIKTLPPKEILRKLIFWSLDTLEMYPIMLSFDNKVIEYLSLKLPKEVIEKHTFGDTDAVDKLQKIGIGFKYSPSIVSQTLRTVFISIVGVQTITLSDKQNIIEILINGMLNEIVCD